MLNLLTDFNANRRPCVLFLGAHSDDIEIGCGATLLRLGQDVPTANIHWVVFAAGGARGDEARSSADDFANSFAESHVELHDFRDSYFPDNFRQIKDIFENLKKSVSPDLVFTHHKDDLHQDHRVVSELTWNTFRNHLILEYEIPKYDGGLRDPNVFVPVSQENLDQKLDKLFLHFDTQRSKKWFSRDLFSALMRLRGFEGASPTGFAEAYYCRKAILQWFGSGSKS